MAGHLLGQQPQPRDRGMSTALPDPIRKSLDHGWTMAWSPAAGWRRDDAVEVNTASLPRDSAYRWALHTSSVQGHTSQDLQVTDPRTYMEWCQLLGFHPSMQSLRKLPDHLTPKVVAPWVPTMVLAFRHADLTQYAWGQDYKRNWSSWLVKAAGVLTPEAALGWGRAAPTWLMAHVEDIGTSRVGSPRMTGQMLWQYTELITRWPDMPEKVAATTAAHLTALCEPASDDPVREAAGLRLSMMVNSAGRFASWRDAVRAAFGFSIVICPERGVLRDYTGTLVDRDAPWPDRLPHPLGRRPTTVA